MVRFLLVLAAIILVLYLIFSEVFATAERFKHKAECRLRHTCTEGRPSDAR